MAEIIFSEELLQEHFDANFDEIRDGDEDEIDFILQSHSGDLLVEESEYRGERFRLWRVLDCNGGGINVEYYGVHNQFVWEIVLED